MPDAGVSPGAGEMGPDGGDLPETPEKNVFTQRSSCAFFNIVSYLNHDDISLSAIIYCVKLKQCYSNNKIGRGCL